MTEEGAAGATVDAEDGELGCVQVRTALTAAAMYRAWVKKTSDLKAHLREALLADAAEFERMAVEVNARVACTAGVRQCARARACMVG